MTDFTTLPPDEMERRRLESVAAMADREKAKFDAWYQKHCDTLYWKIGKCCAGCDHWLSDAGGVGNCSAAGIVSGLDVIKSTGASFCSYTPPPGFPFSHEDFTCGKFKDDFDWSTLPWDYLRSIGAVRHGKLRAKP